MLFRQDKQEGRPEGQQEEDVSRVELDEVFFPRAVWFSYLMVLTSPTLREFALPDLLHGKICHVFRRLVIYAQRVCYLNAPSIRNLISSNLAL